MINNQNKIIHITSEISIKNYSISNFIFFLIKKSFNENNHYILIESLKNDISYNKSFNYIISKNSWLQFFKLKKFILKIYSPGTIFHIHGLWSPLQLYSIIIINLLKIPHVVHCHGMLLNPALKANGFAKFFLKFFFLLLINFIITKKCKFIAITADEKKSILKYFPISNTYLVSNPIPFKRELNLDFDLVRPKKKIFVFFGRVHPHKNIDYIIRIFKEAKLNDNCELRIYGIKDDESYYNKIKKIIRKNKHIHLLPPVFGIEKQKIMRSAWINILLSKSEVLSFSLLESGMLGLPTLVYENFELPEKDNITIKTSFDYKKVIEKFEEISNWSVNYRNLLSRKISNFYKDYKKSKDNKFFSEIQNVYLYKERNEKNVINNGKRFTISSLSYSLNYFFPSIILIFFFISGNPIIAAELGLFSSIALSVTQIFSSNMRAVVKNLSDFPKLDNYYFLRFFFSIMYLIFYNLFILTNFSLEHPNIISLVTIIIFLQWNFEVKLLELELLKKEKIQQFLLLLFSIIIFLSIICILFNKILLFTITLYLFSSIIIIIILNKFIRVLSVSSLNFIYFFKNKLISATLSSFFLIFSGLFWRVFIYNFFEKSVAGSLFTAFSIGSFPGTFFNLILGPAYFRNKILLNKKIKLFLFSIFATFLILNVNIYYSADFFILDFFEYKYSLPNFFIITLFSSILGSFLMTQAMYSRNKAIFVNYKASDIFRIDIIFSILISLFLPLLYYFYGLAGVSYLYLYSSLLGIFLYTFIPRFKNVPYFNK
jgi:glycosyltransferase involved in cell wall biosynthesis